MRNPDRVERFERPDGCSLELRVFNPAASRTIVLSNGLTGGEVLWRHLLDDLATDHRLVTWDYRGQGKSSEAPGPGAYALSAHLADLAAVQDMAGAARATHIGFGMGALVALEHQRWSTKGEVEALVLIQGGPPPGADEASMAASLARRALWAAAPLTPWGVRLARRLRGGAWIHPLALRLQVLGPTCDRQDFETLLDRLGERSPRVQREIARGLAQRSAGDAAAAAAAVPTLIFGAERDLLCPESVTRQLHERIPGSEYISLPGASHASLLELGPIIAGRIRRFLREKVETSPS